MSKFSGCCDLYDHIAGEGGWFNSEGQPVKFNDPDYHGPYYSDELKDFEAFKEKTGGVIHQHHKVEVSEYNQDFVKEHCKEFDFRKIEGTKNKYIYTYWNKEYTLKELNKKGVYIETDIHFNTLLDLIPYYPYLVSMSAYSNSKQYVCISNESYVDYEFKDNLKYGYISQLDYKKELQKHYLEVCKNYFLYKLEERTHVEEIKVERLSKEPVCEEYDCLANYFYIVDCPVDYMHDIEFIWDDGLKHSHWTSLKLVQYNIIKLSKEDIENYLAKDIKNGTVKIKYVEKCEFPLEVE